MSNQYYHHIQVATEYIRQEWRQEITAAAVTGSGLSGIIKSELVISEIPYSSIPHFPLSTVSGHPGKMVLVSEGGKNYLYLLGRHHYYEGYSMQEVTFPIRVLQALGIRHLVLTNAAGGLNPEYKSGDIMLIADHINLHSEHPLRGHANPKLGPRFPNFSAVYHKEWLASVNNEGVEKNYPIKKGVYVGLQGPSLETPAEYKYLRIIGGDAVGMSTVPEAIVAAHAGMNILGISVITNSGTSEDSLKETTHELVTDVASSRIPLIQSLLEFSFKNLPL